MYMLINGEWWLQIREPVKKKSMENSTLRGGLDQVIFHTFFQKKKN